ncbi:MAG: FAD:protein FMN transferase [Planctomycetota bacterium]|jgi:thiamine biosynthesis lipoprotein|nr:FAD:protein FMN transferase [Planctomycetota bacterium]
MASSGDVRWIEGDCLALHFEAMASPCQVLFDGVEESRARECGAAIQAEAAGIEATWSRYRSESIIGRINASAGEPISLDPETADLIDYAHNCFALSDGRFDISCGVLRQAWRFTGGQTEPPDPTALAQILARVGWQRVRWNKPVLQLAPGMEIDLGGIGKEYAVDRALALARGLGAVLVNFGGDLAVTGPRANGAAWNVGSWDDRIAASDGGSWQLQQGALATSGSTQRFFLHQGRRYGHILDPRTGYPVVDAPLSVTVAAGTCTEAGMLATFAMLHGAEAEAFLDQQGVIYRCLRDCN